MKLRFGVICERCKVYMAPGDRGIRVHGRIWHGHCWLAYQDKRRLAHSR